MITVGSITREDATKDFPFLAEKFPGRRKAIKEFTHISPDFVFWIDPDGNLIDAINSHLNNPPKGKEYILNDHPNYGGFLRGRVASNFGPQIIVVYCEKNALSTSKEKIEQFLSGIENLPIPLDDPIVISDNGDIYGNINDLKSRINY